MSKSTHADAVKRVKVKPGIWKRKTATGWRFEITYRDSDGRQRRQVVEGGQRAAETARAKVKADLGMGVRVVPSPALTFGEAAAKWEKAQAATLRRSTRAAYSAAMTTHLLPAWKYTRLDRISVDMVATLVEEMQTAEYRQTVEDRLGRVRTRTLEDGTVEVVPVEDGYKAWTIRGVLVPAGRIFDFSRRRLGWTGVNPVRELDHGERPKSQTKDRRILTREELASLIAAAESPYREIIATAAGLGTRLGETLGITWTDLNLDEGTVTIRHQIDRWGDLVELKTARSHRTVEMPGSLISMLKRHKLASEFSSPDDLVFTSRTGGPLEHRNVAQRGLGKAVKAAGLDVGKRGPTFHELRHAHASAWIAEGGDLVELSARLGHGNPAITASVYSHEFEKAGRSQARRSRLDAMYGAADDVAASVAAAEVSTPQETPPGDGTNIRFLRQIGGSAQ